MMSKQKSDTPITDKWCRKMEDEYGNGTWQHAIEIMERLERKANAARSHVGGAGARCSNWTGKQEGGL